MQRILYRVWCVLCAVMCAIASVTPAAADTIKVGWTADTDPTVTGYIVYVGAKSGAYAESYDVGKATAYTYPNAAAGQTYYFAVAAYKSGVVGAKSNEVSGMSNEPPVLAAPGNQTSAAGQPATLQLTGSDPDGTVLVYSASGLPPGLTLSNSTGLISGSPITAGIYTSTVGATDGVWTASASFTWTVTAAAATAPTLTSPVGTTTSTSPTFVWNAGQGATSYLLYADDSITTAKISMTVTSAQAGCATTTVCSFTPSTQLAPGAAYWAVKAVTATGSALWSDLVQFAVADNTVAPTAATLISPNATTAPLVPTFAWNAGQGAASYKLYVDDSVTTAKISMVLTPAQAGCATTTLCTFSPGVQLAQGAAYWAVRTVSAAGTGVWSDLVQFTVADTSSTATAPTLVAPVNVTTTSNPTFVWTAGQGASSYKLYADDSVTTAKISMSVTPAQAGCATSTTCRFTPGVPLANGAAYWAVRTVTASGSGVWSDLVQFTVADNQGPSITVVSPASTAFETTSANVTLSGTASGANGIAQVSWVNARGGSGTAMGTTTWSAAIDLQPGLNAITITAKDKAGKMADVSSTVIYVTAPVPVGPTGILKGMPAFIWNAAPGASKYALEVTDSSITGKSVVTMTAAQAGCASTASCTYTPSMVLATGPVTWRVETIALTDIGAWSGALGFTLDSAPPSITITSPTKLTTYSTTTAAVILAGVASDDVGVAQVTWTNDRGQTGVAQGTTQWSTGSLSLVQGSTTYTVTVVDRVGNATSRTLTVTYVPPKKKK